MSKCLSNNLSDMQQAQPALNAAQDLLSHAMAPVYRVINGLLVVTVFMVVGLWLSGNGTDAGPFDLARILVPNEARNIVWSNGFGMLDQYKSSKETAALSADTDIASVIYQKSPQVQPQSGLSAAKQQTVALLAPSVAHVQVKSISHLADRIPVSKLDPQALDSNLMGPIQNQRAVADFFEKKYGLEAKDWLKHRCEGAKDIIIKTELPDSTEKYGRIIGHLFINGEATSLNNQMIAEGYAWNYDGGTKVKNFAELDAKRKK